MVIQSSVISFLYETLTYGIQQEQEILVVSSAE